MQESHARVNLEKVELEAHDGAHARPLPPRGGTSTKEELLLGHCFQFIGQRGMCHPVAKPILADQ